jgi:phosphoribosylformimino-5-aminoimidazole carboxamide ribotide isomerase
MQVIPAIDVLNGKVVRLTQGDFARVTKYEDDPVTIAKRYEKEGAECLHVVNLSGAKEGNIDQSFIDLVEIIASKTNLKLQVGGGVRTIDDVKILLKAEASKIIFGTTFFTNPGVVKAASLLLEKSHIIVALDVRNDQIRMKGWQEGTGVMIAEGLTRIREMGIREVLITDIACDGTEEGPNENLYSRLAKDFPELRLIASGGIRDATDIRRLRKIGCSGAVIGKTLLSGQVKLSELLRAARSDLAIRIIPCLDVTNGRVVKGISFQNLRDAGDPVELAARYCEEGADELVFLDITATSDNRDTVYDLVSRVADVVNIPFTIGGGIRSVDDARRLLEAGADKVSVNSAAVKNPLLLTEMAEALGSANTVCAIDAKRVENSWNVLIRGGREDTGLNALEWAVEATERGAGELLITSFDKDGTGEGFDVELLQEIKKRVQVPVIASGGAGSLQTFVDAVGKGKADAVLAASVFHFGSLSVSDVKTALRDASFPVRL